MAGFDLIGVSTNLTWGERLCKEKYINSPREYASVEEEYLDSISEKRIFVDSKSNVEIRRHDRYRPLFEHEHDFFELIYVAQGECSNRIESENFLLTAGNFCLIAPGVRHTLGAFSDGDIIMNIIIRKSTFEQTFTRLLEGANPLSAFFVQAIYDRTGSNYLLFRSEWDAELYGYVGNMTEESRRKEEFSAMMMENYMNLVFCQLMRRYSDHLVTSEKLHPTSADAAQILSYIYRIGVSVTLPDVAERFNYTEPYVSALIKRLTGMTFTQIVTQLRIRQAKTLLVSTELPVKEIARSCGFTSVEHFCRIFRRETKTTPRSYRSGVVE